MTGADDLDVSENWHGGSYELAVNLGPRDDTRMEAALTTVWSSATVEGCLARDEARSHPVPCTLLSLEQFGHLNGRVRLPDGGVIVCGVVAVREENGDDWLIFYLPLGALAEHDARVGAFPFGDDGGEASRAWREPIHT